MSKRFMSLCDFMSSLTYGKCDSKWITEGSEVDDTYEVLIGSNNPIIFTAEDGEQFEVEHIEQEGGGEGGGEYCYTILSVGDKLYKVEYNYYSHQGFDYDGSELVEVVAKKKEITVYE